VTYIGDDFEQLYPARDRLQRPQWVLRYLHKPPSLADTQPMDARWKRWHPWAVVAAAAFIATLVLPDAGRLGTTRGFLLDLSITFAIAALLVMGLARRSR